MGTRQATRRDYSTQDQLQGSQMAYAMAHKALEGWEQLPKGFAHRDLAGLSVEQENRVFPSC